MSVLSDIDDTIKVSDVLDRRELLRHTFVLPFEPVPGMAEAYAAWAGEGATFHYVSSSPSPLYEPLAAFTGDHGFPGRAWHLKPFRLAGRSVLERYPGHAFLLVGDSGEKDPEVYGTVARELPEQVRHVFIRRVDGADNGDARFEAAFASLPRAQWTVFEDPGVLRPSFAKSARVSGDSGGRCT